jgi:hypothetical protein
MFLFSPPRHFCISPSQHLYFNFIIFYSNYSNIFYSIHIFGYLILFRAAAFAARLMRLRSARAFRRRPRSTSPSSTRFDTGTSRRCCRSHCVALSSIFFLLSGLALDLSGAHRVTGSAYAAIARFIVSISCIFIFCLLLFKGRVGW